MLDCPNCNDLGYIVEEPFGTITPCGCDAGKAYEEDQEHDSRGVDEEDLNPFLSKGWQEYTDEAEHIGVIQEEGFGTLEDFVLFLVNSVELTRGADRDSYQQALYTLVRIGWDTFEVTYKQHG